MIQDNNTNKVNDASSNDIGMIIYVIVSCLAMLLLPLFI